MERCWIIIYWIIDIVVRFWSLVLVFSRQQRKGVVGKGRQSKCVETSVVSFCIVIDVVH